MTQTTNKPLTAAPAPQEVSGTPESTGTEDTVTVSRSALSSLVAAAFADAIKRTDDANATAATTEPAETTNTATQPEGAAEQITRSVTELADVVRSLSERVEAIGSQSVVRSDASDPAPQETKRSDVFAGVFSNQSKQ